jgi:hypothetical protein
MKCICKIHGEKEFEINLNGDAFCKECKSINLDSLPDLSMGTSVVYSMGVKVNPPPVPKRIITK